MHRAGTLLLGAWLAMCPASLRATQVPDQISAASIRVVQNDTNNVSTSVTVTTALSINDFRIRPGSNRADYDVQIGDNSTDDVTNGILMTSIDQNGRDNGEAAFPGKNYGTSAIDSNASATPGSSGEYWIPVFQVPNNSEYNFNVAAAYFPYAGGWYGGWLANKTGSNGGANNQLIGNHNLKLGTQIIDKGSGKTTIDLRTFGLDSRTNAVLLVTGGKNEANYALSTTNADGTWTVFCHDDNANGGSYEQDYIAFVAVPLTNHTVVSGKFMGNASIAMKSEPFQVTNPGLGTYHLTIPGVNPNNGVLIISAEGGVSDSVDNIVSYQVNADGWDIQTRDLNPDVTPALQNLPATNAVVSFVYIPGPTPGATSLVWAGTPTNLWNLAGDLVWRTTNNATTNYTDGVQTIFNDSANSFVVNLTAPVSPFEVTVSNSTHDYTFTGNGSIAGAGGLIKQGSGKLTLNGTNTYTGDTTVFQGTLALGASNSLPGGNGFGDVTVNGTLYLAGFNCTINNLSGSGTVDNNAGSGLVNLMVNETTNSTFAGTLKNTAGALSVNVGGGGILTLSGTSILSGNTIVSNATLFVNGSLTTSFVRVESQSGLGGTGTINRPVSLADNSSLSLTANAPLTIGALVMSGSVNVSLAGNLSLTNAATYVLLQHGPKTGNGSFQLTMPAGLQANGFTATLNDTGTQLQLVVVPAGVTGTIADVRHVVILMNENRSFDHYFGTFHGTRGFGDRNAIRFTNQSNAFHQPTGASYELPFHTAIQCITDLNHTWPVTHATVNGGKNDQWIPNKGAETMAFLSRDDIPYYYALADAYTLCDEYHCSVLSCTYPNRMTLMTGMIDPNSTGGGPEIDNSTIASGYTWKTYPELLQAAGINWKVYLVAGDSSDNVIAQFAAFKQAKAGNPLYDRGRAASANVTAMVNAFQGDVISNTLPAVSWIIGPSSYTEHPPYSPANGELLTKQLLDALAANPEVYNSTVFIFNYDENDGFYDHAMPILPPAGTPDEFVGNEPIGLGVRVPAILVSPWSRGGRVCSQVFDHTSVIRFLETWTGVKDPNISAWRRQVCGDLTSAFDFAHPDFDYPYLDGVAGITCPSGDTPSVPATQVMPVQEPGEPKPMPLPYQPNAFCALNPTANTFTIMMTNAGAASVHFGVYPNAFRGDGPWPFDVNTTNSTSTTFDVSTSGGKYDFSCYGPDGFQRRFAGNLSADYQKLEAVSALNPSVSGIEIELTNGAAAAVSFTFTNGYSLNGLATYTVPAHSVKVVNVGSETNNGYYDVTVTANTESSFVRRFLGRVEPVVPPFISSSQMWAGNNFHFTFSGPAGQTYQVMTSTNLSSADSWSRVLSGSFDSGPVVFTETNLSGQPMRFYRVVSP